MCKNILLALVLCWSWCATASGQTSAQLHGRVLNAAGQPLATIAAKLENSAFTATTQADLLSARFCITARDNPVGLLDGDVANSGASTSQICLTNIPRLEVLKGTSRLYMARAKQAV